MAAVFCVPSALSAHQAHACNVPGPRLVRRPRTGFQQGRCCTGKAGMLRRALRGSGVYGLGRRVLELICGL